MQIQDFYKMTRCLAAVFCVICLVGNLQAQETTNFQNMRFSRNEISLLRQIDTIQKRWTAASRLLAIVPLLETITATNAVELAVTVSTNNWDQIVGGIRSISKIRSCELREAIETWRDVDGNNFSGSETRRFFEALERAADRGC